MKKLTIKEVIQSENWIITKVKEMCCGTIRIDARRKFRTADGQNRFSKWCSKSYADKLRREVGKSTLEITEY